jgi:glycosyltransferase involved in cell wall biosynthesis
MQTNTEFSKGCQQVRGVPEKSMHRLSILMVVDGHYPATGGAEMQARLLSASFAEEGHEVEVLAPHLDRSQPTLERIDGIPVTRLAYPRIKGLGALMLNLRFAMWLLKRQHRFDAVHIHMMHNLAGAVGWLKPWLKPTVVGKVSGAAEFQGGILDPAHRHRLVHRLLLAGALRLDAYQCISRRTVNIMADAGFPSDRLHLVPNAVDLQRFRPPEQRDQNTLRAVFVGRHVPVKGLDVLLRAWALAKLPPGARLTIAGDGPERARLLALAKTLGIENEVDFPGLVHNVPALLAEHNLYVQASHQEGLPNAVLEAMAAGLPVLATHISGHEDIVVDDETGFLVPVGDPNAFAQGLSKLASRADLRECLGQAARRFVETRYSTYAVMEALIKLYQGTASESQAQSGQD